MIREHCRSREDALRRERTLERDNKIWQEKYRALQDELSALREQLAKLQAQGSDKE